MSDAEGPPIPPYGNAYKAALARARAYAEAANMKVNRVLTIRAAGDAQGNRHLPAAIPPPQSGGRILAGQTESNVSVQVDFTLLPK